MCYYYMAFIPSQAGGFAILSPDFREIASQGDTEAECMEMASDALRIVVEEYAKIRKPLPVPCSLPEARERITREMKELDSHAPVDEILYQLVKAPTADLTTVKISATVAKYALDIIDEKAKAYGMPRSAFLVRAALAFNG